MTSGGNPATTARMKTQKSSNISWVLKKKKIGDLKPSETNPRTITKNNREKLERDLDAFGNMQPLVVDTDNAILGGHQRHSVYLEKYGGDFEVDVYVPSRQLTEKETQKINLILNTHRGIFDIEKIGNLSLSKIEIADLGIKAEEVQGAMKTPLTYYGGKQTKAGFICSLFDAHKYYVEPFFGGGAVFWHKRLSEYSIVNDTNKGVYSFWKFLQEKPQELKKQILKYALMHEEIFREADAEYRKGEVSIENAVATFFLTRCGMGSGIQTFVLRSNSNAQRMEAIAHEIEEYAKKIQRAHILCRDAISVINLHKKRKDALFFLDPPYVDCLMGHYDGYTDEEFEKLLSVCEEIAGQFVLTVGDTKMCDKYVKKNKWFKVKQDTVAKTSINQKQFVETIITNRGV